MRKNFGPRAAAKEQFQKVLAADHMIKGSTIKQLAEKYDKQIWEVERLLTDAQRTGVYERIADLILKDLIPDSLAALKLAVANGDTDVALRILEGKGVLSRGGKVEVTVNDPLADYRKEKEFDQNDQSAIQKDVI